MHQQQSGRDRILLRTGAITAIAGVTAALVQSAIDPELYDDPAKAIQEVSESHLLTFSRVLDMTAFLLMLIAVAVVTKALSAGKGAGWGRIGLTFFTVSAAAGAIATMVVGSLPDVAQAWAEAPTAQKPGYIAVFDALNNVSGGIFAVSWVALGVFGLVLAAALSRSELFPRPLVWISTASGIASIAAIVVGVGLQIEFAFLLLLLGLLLSYVVIVTAGLRLWSLARVVDAAGAPHPIAAGLPD